ncbi:PhaM family polyhydroxyalkanoate granule multifunctional regulatory protein [Achromobacter sp.]|uniref:PhaM family polyhydroxyalkanoate granule multifunctional regulatory protein n=1 Tax=Achromobacter sp. TaxID=134375 RepID=UPI0028AA8A22|nr:PhaM family polyhydroxyalkanoate granule multifunctional regulatory protein [Achromobacter sp.]
MSDQYNNPFVLPGMGQSSDLSGNPLLASMEMMRQAWAGLTGPGGLASSLPMAPPMNLEDLDRRIAELRSVENWLRMNLSMLSSTIQGMEVQRSTISTLRAFVDSASRMDMGATQDGAAPSPLEVVLGLKPAPKSAGSSAGSAPSGNATAAAEKESVSAQSGAKPEGADASAGTGPESAAAMSEQMGAAAQSASKAWWDLLQQQFNQIAAATAASMPAATPEAPGAAGAAKTKAEPASPKASAEPHATTGKPSAKPAAARKPAAAKRTAKTAKKNGPADGKP